uniref:Phosphoinositide phospholipase C n=1 Tax=Panagrolaimus sp. PS1159 TaxID=55785 RepID=A0AC35FS96_9BILA
MESNNLLTSSKIEEKPKIDTTQNVSNIDVIHGTTTQPPEQVEAAIKALEDGVHVQRIKHTKIQRPMPILLHERKWLKYPTWPTAACLKMCKPVKELKEVDIDELIEVRQGYGTDGLHRASKKFKFQVAAPEARCFSIVYRHPRYVCKSVDFVAESEEQKEYCVKLLHQLISTRKHTMSFDEKQWLMRNFRKADLDRNGQIAFGELWKLLKKLNLQMSVEYVRKLYDLALRESEAQTGKSRRALNAEEFMKLFQILSDLPEYRNALIIANGNSEERLNAQQLLKFLTDEQKFDSIDVKKAESIIAFCEPATDSAKGTLTVNGFRRLLQSRWGNILKQNHENIFMDMTKPLYDYYINSSHNTYLTGLQVRGEATVEGYISALRKGARLLELDVFDGESEPVITHKRTFISAITLRNALRCISKYAFQTSPFPVILTIENHVGFVQQKIMAEIFEEILGDQLYHPPDNAATTPLASPAELKHKILLRGKNSGINDTPVDEDMESPTGPSDVQNPTSNRSAVDPEFGRLIALPSVKIGGNIYQDIQDHPMNGSASLSESKVNTYLQANVPIAAYTSSRLIKSYPRGIRQDSSNMNPIPSWLCGIQCVAMNLQTPGEDMDINNGMFAINGQCGYVLKPKVLRDGLDPRQCSDVKVNLHVAVICGQYLPKANPQGNDIIDPYVTLELFGIPFDLSKSRTRAIKNNGFNPVWNENFTFPLRCPEVAILRFCVKDFDSTSSNDFIGEYTVPVPSIRPGYSHIRLNTGFDHSPDDAASLFKANIRSSNKNTGLKDKKESLLHLHFLIILF